MKWLNRLLGRSQTDNKRSAQRAVDLANSPTTIDELKQAFQPNKPGANAAVLSAAKDLFAKEKELVVCKSCGWPAGFRYEDGSMGPIRVLLDSTSPRIYVHDFTCPMCSTSLFIEDDCHVSAKVQNLQVDNVYNRAVSKDCNPSAAKLEDD